MSQLKDQQTGASADNFTVGGNLAVTGTTTFTGIPSGPTASPATNTTQLATTAFVLANSVPTGAINMWGTATAPTGYLLCAGAAVSRTTYAALFAVISTTFGVGDGSTTFNLPNYTSRFPYGTTLASTGGTADAVIVSHTHTATVTDPTHSHNLPNTAIAQTNNGQQGRTDGSQASAMTTTSSASTGISVTNTTEGVSGVGQNLPPYLGINFIIKT